MQLEFPFRPFSTLTQEAAVGFESFTKKSHDFSVLYVSYAQLTRAEWDGDNFHSVFRSAAITFRGDASSVLVPHILEFDCNCCAFVTLMR